MKNAVRKSNLEPTLLIGTLLSRIDHGPFLSGSNWVAKNECLRKLVSEMTQAQFDELVENMEHDHTKLDDEDGLQLNAHLPETKEDLLAEPAVTTTGIFAAWAAARLTHFTRKRGSQGRAATQHHEFQSA